ncbi:hypothetical protein BC940DRAFT_295864 [Gongronella butleri]|nr:hypothetical protein BC940DRAFT_295864 [Gongronella butleri]
MCGLFAAGLGAMGPMVAVRVVHAMIRIMRASLLRRHRLRIVIHFEKALIVAVVVLFARQQLRIHRLATLLPFLYVRLQLVT